MCSIEDPRMEGNQKTYDDFYINENDELFSDIQPYCMNVERQEMANRIYGPNIFLVQIKTALGGAPDVIGEVFSHSLSSIDYRNLKAGTYLESYNEFENKVKNFKVTSEHKSIFESDSDDNKVIQLEEESELPDDMFTEDSIYQECNTNQNMYNSIKPLNVPSLLKFSQEG